jgi:putative hydrolase of the HAD superfamily
MKTPKMLLFDYGSTLLCEPDTDFVRGERALFPYITKNRYHLTPEQLHGFADALFAQAAKCRDLGMELHERQFQRMVYEYSGIEFSIGYEQAELILWDAASPGALMPDADKIIDCVNRNGIRSGVISNIGWSENALQNRLDRLLPRNRFEFVIASSEYGFRKPSPYLFELALRKVGLPPDAVWFCGDNPRADVEGAAQVGIFPLWYVNDAGRAREGIVPEPPPRCGHLRFREWKEVISILDELKERES